MKRTLGNFFLWGLFCGAPVIHAESPDLYLAGKSNLGIVLCHGAGANPDWKVVGHLRKSLNAGELNASTLSLQMPKLTGKWTDYLKTFPAAMDKIRGGIARLKKAGAETVVLIGHSMGSRMASYFLANEPNHQVSLFVGLGMRNNGEGGLNVITNLRRIKIPMLDIYGTGGGGGDSRYGEERRAAKIAGVHQIVIEGANHKFDGYGANLDQEITVWLKEKILGKDF